MQLLESFEIDKSLGLVKTAMLVIGLDDNKTLVHIPINHKHNIKWK